MTQTNYTKITNKELIEFLETEIEKCEQHSIFDTYSEFKTWNDGFKEALIVVLEKLTEKDDQTLCLT